MKSFQLAPGSDGYPVGLIDLEEPPVLWQVGALSERPGVAVVGTRRCTRYGLDLAEAFGGVIARAGWTTVSGLARGIDTAAHRGCLRISGHAVAVLGSGIDVCYPKENEPVYERIVETGGAILSEYPPGTPPDRWRFPARNRILAAISSAVVVVEAAATGGALITARLGAEMGRPVFAVPGDVDREMSEGCNRLIRDGAHPVLGSADLIEELSLILGPPAPATDLDHGIPSEGVEIKELPALWSLTVTESLIKLGRLEMAGQVKRYGDHVMPA
ncbi:MAG TPA: DNA-processing protein DprA [Acidimicrobiia bacterium]